MAIAEIKGVQISYECEDLIESLKLDISEYSKSCRVYAISEMMQGDLHPIMFLLNPNFDGYPFQSYINLHPIMFLLNLNINIILFKKLLIYIPLCSY